MKRRIKTALVIFFVAEAAAIGLGLALTEPSSGPVASDPVTVALSSKSEVLHVGDIWELGLTVTNETGEKLENLREPVLDLESVSLTIEYRSRNTGRENEPEELVEIRRIHGEGESALLPLAIDAHRSADFPLLSFPAIRAGTYTISATYRWALDKELSTEPRDFVVLPGKVEDQEEETLAMILVAAPAQGPGEEQAIRLKFLPTTGLAAAIQVATLASQDPSHYAGRPILAAVATVKQDATEKKVSVLRFGATDDEGNDPLGYSVSGQTTPSGIEKEWNLVGLYLHENSPEPNLHSGRAVFDLVVGEPFPDYMSSHVPFARTSGDVSTAAQNLAGRRAAETVGPLEPAMKLVRIEFEPKPTPAPEEEKEKDVEEEGDGD
ncbi:MAG: hypothetical protein HY720_00585 [Planctomycetes bacterium]|nr:hypothetical protein [Planctomycetota bacterium]